jgi:uncharacterized protein
MASESILINDDISGILSYPDNIANSDTVLPAVLFLHGFATDKNEVDDFYRKMSTKLAADNIVSLRIDFTGFGESKKAPQNSSIDTMISDATEAFKYLSSLSYVNPNAIGIVGFSLGAAIAILAAKTQPCRSLVLLSPVSNLVKDFTAFLGNEVMGKLDACTDFVEVTLPWRKIKIGKAFYTSLSNYDPLESIQTYTEELVCIAGTRDFSAENIVSIDSLSPSPKKSKHLIEGAGHIFELENGTSKLGDIASLTCSLLEHGLSEEDPSNDRCTSPVM